MVPFAPGLAAIFAALAALAVSLAACGTSGVELHPDPHAAARAVGVDPALLLQARGDLFVAAQVEGTGLVFYGFTPQEPGGWRLSAQGGMEAEAGGGWRGNTVAITGFPAGASEAGTYVYGTADPGVARVNVAGLGAVGGDVRDGVWIVYLPDASLYGTPERVAWQFLDADGRILAAGAGERTP